MGVARSYKPINSLALKANITYTKDNIPSAADIVVLGMGVRLYDQNGEKTPLRGIRMQIVDNEPAATTPVPKVPTIWLEGDELVFDTDYTYTPLDNGVVTYGILVV